MCNFCKIPDVTRSSEQHFRLAAIQNDAAITDHFLCQWTYWTFSDINISYWWIIHAHCQFPYSKLTSSHFSHESCSHFALERLEQTVNVSCTFSSVSTSVHTQYAGSWLQGHAGLLCRREHVDGWPADRHWSTNSTDVVTWHHWANAQQGPLRDTLSPIHAATHKSTHVDKHRRLYTHTNLKLNGAVKREGTSTCSLWISSFFFCLSVTLFLVSLSLTICLCVFFPSSYQPFFDSQAEI